MSTFQKNSLASVKIFIALLSFALSTNIFGGCKNSVIDNNNNGENPDSIDAKFVWRICNESDEYAMENILIENYYTDNMDSLILGTLSPGECTKYYAGTYNGERPINLVRFEQGGESYHYVYLASRPATRGLKDSTLLIQDAPGKYTYYFSFNPDTAKHTRSWSIVEIERETYFK